MRSWLEHALVLSSPGDCEKISQKFWIMHLSPEIILNFPEFRLEDLFEKSDMKMENGNMGSESRKKS